MLETIRHYAARRLADANEADSARCRHFGYFRAAAARRDGERQDAYRERLRLDYADIRRALEWAGGQEDPELLLGLATRVAAFWSLSTRLAEARYWLHTAVDGGARACRCRGPGRWAAWLRSPAWPPICPPPWPPAPRASPCCASSATPKA